MIERACSDLFVVIREEARKDVFVQGKLAVSWRSADLNPVFVRATTVAAECCS